MTAQEVASVPRWSKAATPDAYQNLVDAGYPGWLATVLARRGVGTTDEAATFLDPRLDQLGDPLRLAGVGQAVDRLVHARTNNQKLAIVGDYDVDGVSATAILLAVVRRCGLEAEPVLPNRFQSGYGFQPVHVDRALDKGCSLIVTADCGSTAHQAIAMALDKGVDVIVTDHHLSSEPLPDQVIEVNPKREDSDKRFRDLSGAGVAFKLATALATKLEIEIAQEALLRIACLGTICDLVPLLGENRVIASLGLKALGETRSRGLLALIERAGLLPPFRSPDIGFRIGPRINAAGRLGDPTPALELLMTRDTATADRIAAELEELNRRRQEEELRVVEEAEGRFQDLDELPPILVSWDRAWHRGVVGIAAGRIARRFHRPTVLLSVADGSATGSGRSIQGVHLHQFLARWESSYERFGGHAQAVGLTVLEEQLESITATWIGAAAEEWSADVLRREREYELELEPGQLDVELLEQLRQLEPFGMSNRQPLIRVGPLSLKPEVRKFGNGHLSAVGVGNDGASIDLLGWGWQERLDDLAGRIEVLGCLEFDRYRRKPTLRLVDARAWSASPAKAYNQ